MQKLKSYDYVMKTENMKSNQVSNYRFYSTLLHLIYYLFIFKGRLRLRRLHVSFRLKQIKEIFAHFILSIIFCTIDQFV
jgi:hypothetical protein